MSTLDISRFHREIRKAHASGIEIKVGVVVVLKERVEIELIEDVTCVHWTERHVDIWLVDVLACVMKYSLLL